MNVDLFDELTRVGVKWEYTGNSEWVSVICPFHDDHTPSCAINTKTHVFKCHACGAGGDIAKFLARKLGVDKSTILIDFHQRYGLPSQDKPISVDVVEKYHNNIWQALPLLKELEIRGVNETLIRKYRLGEDKGKITIPISNANGTWVNIYRYSPGAKSGKKFIGMSGRGKPVRLYPYEQLSYKKLVLCGGFIKAIGAAGELNEHGIGAVTVTTGEGGWPIDLIKIVAANRAKLWICMDIDAAGQAYANDLAYLSFNKCDWVSIIHLPLDPDKHPKGDISDWIGLEQEQLLPLLESSEQWHIPEQQTNVVSEKSQKVTIQNAARASHANARLQFRGLVSAIEQEAYYLPKLVRASCDKQQELCSICPLYPEDDDPTVTISPENEHLLSMINANKHSQRDAVRKALSIPPCKSVKFHTAEFYHVQHAILTQDLDSHSLDESVQLQSVSIDCDLDINETYDLTGRVVPHPNTQRATAILSGRNAVEDTLGKCEIDPDKLSIFQPDDWTMSGIARKLEHLYKDYEQSVTSIYERRDLHLLFDLAWHSVLYLKYNNRIVKGWVEVCVIGDTSQGKTDTAKYMLQHYGLGQRVDCKNATVAGLLGGLQAINNRYFVSWGILPMNDRRLVILEEIKGAHPEVITKLTDTRSSGIAEIPKIEKRKAHSRVRLIAISNSRSGNDVDTYSYGTEIVRELIPNLEDIRRFDAFSIISRNEVPIDVIQYAGVAAVNQNKEPIYTSEACRSLILWAWTRKPEQVIIEDWQYVMQAASQLCNQFTDSMPIVDRGSAKFKIARLAAALAARTFSHGESVEELLVRNGHVDYVVDFLRRSYSSKAFGYDRFTKAVMESSELRNAETIARRIIDLPYTQDFLECILRANEIDLRDLCDWCNWDRNEAADLMSLLVRNHAVKRDGRAYRKTPQFVELLNKLVTDDRVKNKSAPPPDYVKEKL